jgi:hypothetical protein
MPLIRIDLQDGFAHDRVTVRINGTPVLDEGDATTRTQLSLAKIGQAREVEPGPARIEVEVPSRNLRGEETLMVQADTYIGVSVLGDRLTFRASNERYGYV